MFILSLSDSWQLRIYYIPWPAKKLLPKIPTQTSLPKTAKICAACTANWPKKWTSKKHMVNSNTSFPRNCAPWKSALITRSRWLLKSVTTAWSSAVKQTPLGESKCFHMAPSKPYLFKYSPLGEKSWMRWFRVSDTKIWSLLLQATSHG